MSKKIKLAYIGGGSKAWARVFFNDLTLDDSLYGEIALYDIDYEAAVRNQQIGERLCVLKEAKSEWNYTVHKEIGTALDGADFVIISILPGTFEHMRSDVHAPEKYGIYQSVGDTAGPGGILRAMRTVPLYEGFAREIKAHCPDAWVINFTNPMSICVKVLYDVFPEIKAFGCCHEVFHAQQFLCAVLNDITGEETPKRNEIFTDASGVNHFTWITKAYYKNIDLLSLLPQYMKKHPQGVYFSHSEADKETDYFSDRALIKLDLFKRYGALGAAGDRHLAEFFDRGWYLENPERVKEMGFALTDVDYRVKKQAVQIKESVEMAEGKLPVELKKSDEEAVALMKAVLGLGNIVSNVNMPNKGQMTGIPLGSIVETNCVFTHNSVNPVVSKALPTPVQNMVQRACLNIDTAYEGIKERDMDKIFESFANQPLCGGLDIKSAELLFMEMIEGTKECLVPFYNL